MPNAAFFDLDKTIIARSSALAFTTPFAKAGLLSKRSILRNLIAQTLFTLGGADHERTERLRVQLSKMVEGWSSDQVSEIVQETLHQFIEPIIYAEAADLIDEHHRSGRKVVIVSSSAIEIVKPIGEMLGADDIIATRLKSVDGRYTGEIEYYAYGPTKAAAIRELAAREGFDLSQCFAYSDSSTDIPMLETVGFPTVVNPDLALRKVAIENGWGIAAFKRTVPLRERYQFEKPAMATAIGVTAVSLIALAIARKHRRAAS
ncbi:phosphoserine phosphatase [mine drainage metagenome]|uniref:Phosphoserine phosphatase n=1 Tax=mine drainage metagenome TaxID=410659 RepID=A0A1J5Q130_9ZZZZ